MKPTKKQIEKAVADLKEIKPKVRHYSAFGDNHHAAIEAQIRVLERNMSEDAIYDHWDDPEGDMTVRDAALYALQWMTSGKTDEGETDLVEGWRELIV